MYVPPTHIKVGPVRTGSACTVTYAVPATLVHPFTVMVTLYVPDATGVAFVIVGVRMADVNPFGPVHAYVAPVTAAVDKVKLVP